jgi:hypothetical protein
MSSANEEGYALEQGIMRYQGRIWLGGNLAVQTRLIVAFHARAIRGHSGSLECMTHTTSSNSYSVGKG